MFSLYSFNFEDNRSARHFGTCGVMDCSAEEGIEAVKNYVENEFGGPFFSIEKKNLSTLKIYLVKNYEVGVENEN